MEKTIAKIMGYNSPFAEDSLFEEKSQAPIIKNIRILNNGPFNYGQRVNFRIETSGLKGGVIKISVWEDDTLIGLGTDTLIEVNEYYVSTDIIFFNLLLTDEMRKKAHPSSYEGKSAEYYIKVSGFGIEAKESSRFDVLYKDYTKKENFYGQEIFRPDEIIEKIHEEAIAIVNANSQTTAFLTPDEKLFIWVNDGDSLGYYENGIVRDNNSYSAYAENKLKRKDEPISWGIYLAANDIGEFAIILADNPLDVAVGLLKLFGKIVTLDFDLEKTWDKIINADLTDASYAIASLLLGYLAGPKGTKAIKSKDMHKFSEVVEESVKIAKEGGKKLTMKEVLVLFAKALEFENIVTKELLKKYPASQGYSIISRLYLKFGKVTTIADNVIYNSKTGKFILNETKYGVSNKLRKNQKIIEDAIKAGEQLEVRSSRNNLNGFAKLKQGDEIKISKILRSHSIDGKITQQTIQEIWSRQ